MKTRLPPPEKVRSIFDLPAFKELPFLVHTLGLFFALMGLYFPFFYLPTFTTAVLNASDDTAFYMLAILNATSTFGRIIPGLLADKIGSLNMIIPCGLSATILAFTWMGVTSVSNAATFAVFYGFFSGAIVSLPPTIVAGLSPHMGVVGTRMGMCFAVAGLGLLIGNPIAGSMVDIKSGDFGSGQLFSALIMFVASVCFVWVRVLQTLRGKGWKM